MKTLVCYNWWFFKMFPIFLSLFAEDGAGFRMNPRGVAGDDSDELLREGAIRSAYQFHRKGRKRPIKRWMILFLAAVVVVIVALLVMWFMRA